jgi:hypothetical protein
MAEICPLKTGPWAAARAPLRVAALAMAASGGWTAGRAARKGRGMLAWASATRHGLHASGAGRAASVNLHVPPKGKMPAAIHHSHRWLIRHSRPAQIAVLTLNEDTEVLPLVHRPKSWHRRLDPV